MGSWCCTCVEFAHTSLSLCSLPNLHSLSHWLWVLEQVVYSNKDYLKVLDFSAIHLSCLSGLIVNVHPPINPRQGSLSCVPGPLPSLRQEVLISSSSCSSQAGCRFLHPELCFTHLPGIGVSWEVALTKPRSPQQMPKHFYSGVHYKLYEAFQPSQCFEEFEFLVWGW